MDDIDLLARSANLLQEILNISSLFLKRRHLKVNIKKVQRTFKIKLYTSLSCKGNEMSGCRNNTVLFLFLCHQIS